jgi:hypothetical protein
MMMTMAMAAMALVTIYYRVGVLLYCRVLVLVYCCAGVLLCWHIVRCTSSCCVVVLLCVVGYAPPTADTTPTS